MKAWLVKPTEEVEEIEVSGGDNTLIEVGEKYFEGEVVTLTRVDIRRLPLKLYKELKTMRKRDLQLNKDRFVHFSVDDNGLWKGLPPNPIMSEAYAEGTSMIVGLAVVYSELLP